MSLEALKSAGQSITSESLTEKVYQFLETSILEMKLKPGDQLNEVDIANVLNVSRSPVREALLRLEHVGLVNKSRKFRTVSYITEESIINNYHMWNMTESYASVMASTVATPDDLLNIEEALVKMGKFKNEKDIGSYRELNNQFHMLLVAPCPYANIVECHRNAMNHIKWGYNYTLMGIENMSSSEAQHSDIFDAYKSKNLDALERIIRTHINSALDRMLRYYRSNNLSAEFSAK